MKRVDMDCLDFWAGVFTGLAAAVIVLGVALLVYAWAGII
jgi:hypothetical protein